MTTATKPPPPAPHDAASHPATPHLAHHFDTPVQQYEAATQGMWLFVATEILLFAGLFCAYSVYRANHPEIFIYAHHYLSVPLGATNTAILLISSFTMATGVWAAERGRRALLCTMLALTIACGGGFLGIKYVEYKHKWEEGLGWGKYYHPHTAAGEHGATTHAAAAPHEAPADHPSPATTPPASPAHTEGPATAAAAPASGAAPAASSTAASTPDSTSAPATAATPDLTQVFQPLEAGPPWSLDLVEHPVELALTPEVRNVHTFFGIYFVMTGLHGVHVIAGMIAIGWLLMLGLKGRFTPTYFTPVPLVGLYWHVVDLIWIYLFPLLYLIH